MTELYFKITYSLEKKQHHTYDLNTAIYAY